MSTETEPGQLHALLLDGKGGATRLDADAMARWTPGDGPLWVNFDYSQLEAARWLETSSGIDPVAREALLDADPRPRATLHGDALMMIVRGINQNQGSSPEDMISVRVWAEPERVITMRHRVSRSIRLLLADLDRGHGPRTASDVVVRLVDKIVDHVVVRVDSLGDDIAGYEDQILSEKRGHDLRAQLADRRRRAIALRRFLAPQREALAKLAVITLPWITAADRQQIAESADRLMRSVEELDAARDRAAVTQEEVASRMGELTNQRLYVLSIITAVFLPLGFVCSLLGVNVGGVPLQKAEWAFWALLGVFVVGVAIQLWVFRRRGWIKRD